jgi:hypothetical protein
LCAQCATLGVDGKFALVFAKKKGACLSCLTQRGELIGAVVLVALVIWVMHGVLSGGSDATDVCTRIYTSHLQVVSLAASFPLEWPDSVLSIFSLSNTLMMSDEALTLECILPTQSAVSFFFQKQLFFFLSPFAALILCVLVGIAYARIKSSSATRRQRTSTRVHPRPEDVACAALPPKFIPTMKDMAVAVAVHLTYLVRVTVYTLFHCTKYKSLLIFVCLFAAVSELVQARVRLSLLQECCGAAVAARGPGHWVL